MRNYYADPTANTAIANVDRERCREQRRQQETERLAREKSRQDSRKDAGRSTECGNS